MTIDPKDPEVQAIIKAAVEKEVEGLKNKNAELLGKLNEAKGVTEKLTEYEKQLKQIEEQKLKDSENWSELETRLRNEAAEKESALKEERNKLKSMYIDNTLTSELVKANIAPHALDMARAYFAGQVEYKDDKVLVQGKALSEYVSEWASSEQGKHFVAAPANRGGNARGGDSAKSTVTMTRTEFEKVAARDPQGTAKFFKDGGTVVDE